MANRIVGNVYIVDSALNNVSLPWPQGGRIQTIRAWFSATNGLVRFTGSDTTNAICILTPDANMPVSGTTPESHLGGVRFDEMKVPVITAGTAWIYFS